MTALTSYEGAGPSSHLEQLLLLRHFVVDLPARGAADGPARHLLESLRNNKEPGDVTARAEVTTERSEPADHTRR